MSSDEIHTSKIFLQLILGKNHLITRSEFRIVVYCTVVLSGCDGVTVVTPIVCSPRKTVCSVVREDE
jgi:hypothetical protein